MRDPLDKVLELVPVPDGNGDNTVPVRAQEDFDFARESVRTTIAGGEKAFKEVLEIGAYTSQPRAYEVAGQLMRAIIEGNRELLALRKTQQEISERDAIKGGARTINNNLILTSSEMLDIIKKNFPKQTVPNETV